MDAIRPVTLEQRFIEFLTGLPDAECLDTSDFVFPPGVRKADFLLDGRSIIAELKTVKSDPKSKIERRINQHLSETGRHVFGTILSTQLFKSDEESDRFHQQIIRHITRNTEEMCRSANEQIAHTGDHLGISAKGLLVILNEDVAVLDPGVVAFRVSEYLTDKARRIQYCLLIFESHEIDHGEWTQNQMLMIRARCDDIGCDDAYLSGLMRRWAEYNGSEYYERETSNPSEIQYRALDDRPLGK